MVHRADVPKACTKGLAKQDRFLDVSFGDMEKVEIIPP